MAARVLEPLAGDGGAAELLAAVREHQLSAAPDAALAFYSRLIVQLGAIARMAAPLVWHIAPDQAESMGTHLICHGVVGCMPLTIPIVQAYCDLDDNTSTPISEHTPSGALLYDCDRWGAPRIKSSLSIRAPLVERSACVLSLSTDDASEMYREATLHDARHRSTELARVMVYYSELPFVDGTFVVIRTVDRGAHSKSGLRIFRRCPETDSLEGPFVPDLPTARGDYLVLACFGVRGRRDRFVLCLQSGVFLLRLSEGRDAQPCRVDVLAAVASRSKPPLAFVTDRHVVAQSRADLYVHDVETGELVWHRLRPDYERETVLYWMGGDLMCSVANVHRPDIELFDFAADRVLARWAQEGGMAQPVRVGRRHPAYVGSMVSFGETIALIPLHGFACTCRVGLVDVAGALTMRTLDMDDLGATLIGLNHGWMRDLTSIAVVVSPTLRVLMVYSCHKNAGDVNRAGHRIIDAVPGLGLLSQFPMLASPLAICEYFSLPFLPTDAESMKSCSRVHGTFALVAVDPRQPGFGFVDLDARTCAEIMACSRA